MKIYWVARRQMKSLKVNDHLYTTPATITTAAAATTDIENCNPYGQYICEAKCLFVFFLFIAVVQNFFLSNKYLARYMQKHMWGCMGSGH
jgi:hypothetical protein